MTTISGERSHSQILLCKVLQGLCWEWTAVIFYIHYPSHGHHERTLLIIIMTLNIRRRHPALPQVQPDQQGITINGRTEDWVLYCSRNMLNLKDNKTYLIIIHTRNSESKVITRHSNDNRIKSTEDLDQSISKQQIHSTVMSPLDTCNLLLLCPSSRNWLQCRVA